MPDDRSIPDRLKDYTDVKERIGLFYKAHPDGRLVTDRVEIWQDDDIPRVVVRALAYRSPDDTLPGTGWSWMVLPGTTNFTRGSEIENTETSAWGRAIGSLGIGISKGIGSADELAAHEGQAPAPATVQESEGGLIGVASLGKAAPVDGEPREGPQGRSVGFVLGEGREKVQVVAWDSLADDILAVLPLIVGQRVQVYGPVSIETMRVGKYDRRFPRLTLVQIKTDDFILPATVASPPDAVAGEAVPEPLGLM
jgi:hypothetical protein